VLDVLRRRARDNPAGAAIIAPGRRELCNAALLVQVGHVRDCFRACGIGPRDVVALSMPNSPEMTLAYLASMASAVCAPLNPVLTPAEFDYYLAGLGTRAIIVPEGVSTAAEAAARLNVAAIELTPDPQGPAGAFTLHHAIAPDTVPDGESASGDIALLLYTSGTTSRAKLVPLSHANILASARNVATPLRLSAADRGLSVMPLFHSHGLLGSTWAAIATGGSLICPGAFAATEFFGWLRDFQPTWYTTVPTMHQAILARAGKLGHRAFRLRVAYHPVSLIIDAAFCHAGD
jgi:acyl-CoA synthetase (AMP-forming)/AMP-acid ligase II